MNFVRLILPIVGLFCIVLFYVLRIELFLLLAVIVFVAGAFLIGPFSRQKKKNQVKKDSKDKNGTRNGKIQKKRSD